VKILIVSKALLISAYRERLNELATLDNVQLSALSPKRFKGETTRSQKHGKFAHHIHNLFFPNSYHLNFYPSFRRLVAEVKPDLVHIDDEPFNFVTYHASRILSSLRIKHVFTTLQNIKKSYPPPFNSFEHFVLKHSDGAIALSDCARDLLIDKVIKKLVEVIPYGVDVNVFCRKANTRLKNSLGLGEHFVVGYAGRLAKEKGMDTLVESLSALREKFRVLVVGEGPYKRHIMKEVRKRGMEKKFVFAGHVNSLEIPQYLNCMDCLIMPSLTTSRWREQFGRALIEAMACEIPVVGSGSGEIPNVLSDAGLIFNEGAALALRDCIVKLIKNTELRTQLAQKGRMRVMNCYASGLVVRSTSDFYARIMNR